MINQISQTLLFIGSFAFLAWGFVSLTEITVGVGLIAIAGILAIFMRIAQAAHHQKENEELLDKIFAMLTMMENKERE